MVMKRSDDSGKIFGDRLAIRSKRKGETKNGSQVFAGQLDIYNSFIKQELLCEHLHIQLLGLQ